MLPFEVACDLRSEAVRKGFAQARITLPKLAVKFSVIRYLWKKTLLRKKITCFKSHCYIMNCGRILGLSQSGRPIHTEPLI